MTLHGFKAKLKNEKQKRHETPVVKSKSKYFVGSPKDLSAYRLSYVKMTATTDTTIFEYPERLLQVH